MAGGQGSLGRNAPSGPRGKRHRTQRGRGRVRERLGMAARPRVARRDAREELGAPGDDVQRCSQCLRERPAVGPGAELVVRSVYERFRGECDQLQRRDQRVRKRASVVGFAGPAAPGQLASIGVGRNCVQILDQRLRKGSHVVARCGPPWRDPPSWPRGDSNRVQCRDQRPGKGQEVDTSSRTSAIDDPTGRRAKRRHLQRHDELTRDGVALALRIKRFGRYEAPGDRDEYGHVQLGHQRVRAVSTMARRCSAVWQGTARRPQARWDLAQFAGMRVYWLPAVVRRDFLANSSVCFERRIRGRRVRCGLEVRR
mmetsp:Transcript_20355/g.56620  ORF Transcript_20355/g.56620 Transcript_20355/m.56620 type:complete len:312 (+) Transcript_20355:243-1178(+)